ncbi:hypothetical protein HYU12_02330 [Candidatus Woesearchaeota archaeon]|nr:hypothetical protein [Candidatus Woesearchaeota archaeon]
MTHSRDGIEQGWNGIGNKAKKQIGGDEKTIIGERGNYGQREISEKDKDDHLS